MDFHDPKLWTCKLHFHECDRSSWRRWEEHENTLSNSSPVVVLVVLCLLNRHISKLLISFFTFRKKRVSRRGKHSRKPRLLMATEYVKMLRSVCNQPRILYFLDFLAGLDHVLGYYIATHCWWATVSYAELRNKGHVWLAESNSKIPGILLANPKSHSKRVKPRDWKSVISLRLSSLSLQRRWITAKI